MKNRFALAPMTNTQSGEDGILSEEEYKWLTMRAEGGFGLTMTCAAHVQKCGKGFPGQLGIFGDEHLEGLTRLAVRIRELNSIAIIQLHHAGMRSPVELIDQTPVCPSDNAETGARGLTHAEVKQLIADFIAAAVRAEKAGFDGVEVHGAHGYILCQFLSQEINHRDDEYGGSLENRARIIDEIITGIRQHCSDQFMLGLRLSPERFGMQMADALQLAQHFLQNDQIDFLDMSLWDVNKEPEEEPFKGQSLLFHFAKLDRGNIRLGVAGQIRTPEEAEKAMESGIDFIMLGRAAIIHHDFPDQYKKDSGFKALLPPVSRQHLIDEGLSSKFLNYMSRFQGFIKD